MWIRTNRSMIDLKTVRKIKCQSSGINGEPCIAFIHEFGKYMPIQTEICFPDYPTAERWFDELHEAIKANVPIFDMR